MRLPLRGQVSTTERGWLSELQRQGRLRHEDRALLLAVLREEQVNNTRAREVLGVDSVDARNALQRLRDAGLLDQHGTRGRAYYTLGTIGPERSMQQILLEAVTQEPLTNQRVRDLTGLDRPGARRILSRMVNDGLLLQVGERRATRYTLPD